MPRSVFITGCSSGIGRCAAIELKKRGYRVLAGARKPADLEALEREGFETIAIDLNDSASVQAAARKVLRLTDNRLYGLFNNAGFGIPGAVEDLTREALRAQFETNLFGAIELTNALLPAMRAAGEGRIVQNSSVLGLTAFPFRGAYNASKFALEGISDTLRLELRGSGVHLSLIEPGPITSRFRHNAYQAYLRYIDADASIFRKKYAAMEKRLLKEGDAQPFTLPPEAVVKKLLHALESPRPRIRYSVTVPTVAFATLRRLLPYRWMDWILLKASGDGAR
ncbi:MAG TPA: SDR family NAD(P)-dependent oxidoreductase [Gammaproteobacteria bacterium]|nr:SDR family NAD(P)-dependent oxidoreductase [Gammaproteobacteria bacterium]